MECHDSSPLLSAAILSYLDVENWGHRCVMLLNVACITRAVPALRIQRTFAKLLHSLQSINVSLQDEPTGLAKFWPKHV